jgi:hypothetical protein
MLTMQQTGQESEAVVTPRTALRGASLGQTSRDGMRPKTVRNYRRKDD